MPEAEPDPLTGSRLRLGGVVLMPLVLASTNENHGKGGCGAIELSLLLMTF
jgi:hypothetical protein